MRDVVHLKSALEDAIFHSTELSGDSLDLSDLSDERDLNNECDLSNQCELSDEYRPKRMCERVSTIPADKQDCRARLYSSYGLSA